MSNLQASKLMMTYAFDPPIHMSNLKASKLMMTYV